MTLAAQAYSGGELPSAASWWIHFLLGSYLLVAPAALILYVLVEQWRKNRATAVDGKSPQLYPPSQERAGEAGSYGGRGLVDDVPLRQSRAFDPERWTEY